jgi:hypothetical protein
VTDDMGMHHRERDQLPFAAEVRAYLADCAEFPDLDRRYHPTADGAVKLIAHRGADQADQIRAAFEAITTGPGGPVLPDPPTDNRPSSS